MLLLLLANNQWPIAFLMLSSGWFWKSATLQGIRLHFLLGYPFISAQKWVQIIKITHWVMICDFLLTCTPLFVGSVWQWKLIFFSLRGDITMINLSMEWRKLENCCNMRSEINLLRCEKSWGMWGINKYEITLSVFSSNRKRESFGKAPLCWKCDPLWPSLGWKELGN